MTNPEDRRVLPDGSPPTSISVRAVDAYADALPQLHLRARPDGVVTFLNLRYEELTGADRDPAVREALWRDRIHPEDLDGLESALTGGDVGDRDVKSDFRLLHADGSFRWMRLTARIVQDEAGDLVWHGLASDVQDERATRGDPDAISRGLRERMDGQAAELASLEARYASLFAISRIAFAEQDMSGTALILRDLKAQGIQDLAAYMAEHPETLARCVASVKTVSVNDACVRMLGFDDVDGAVDRTVDGTAEDIEAVLLRQFEMIFYGWESVEGRVVLIGARGRRVPVFYSVTRLDDERQLSSLVDISSQEEVEEMRRAAQAELARASRIATVGAFSASIAHELNQPVASISMDANTGLRLLRRPQPDVGAAVRVLERVSVTIERVSTIVRHTHERIQGGRQNVRRIDLGRLARETCALLARDMRSCGVSVRYVGSDAPAVEGDFVDLQQVLINLINNARDAMLDVERDEKIVTVDVRGVGDHVELAVADVGAGISENDRTRVFQPFFTTKKEGVGLGLQICLSTIQRMGGEMSVANGPVQGAVFTCRLPALRG